MANVLLERLIYSVDFIHLMDKNEYLDKTGTSIGTLASNLFFRIKVDTSDLD